MSIAQILSMNDGIYEKQTNLLRNETAAKAMSYIPHLQLTHQSNELSLYYNFQTVIIHHIS